MRFLGWLFTLGVYGSIVGVAMIAGVIWWYAQDDQLPSTEVLSNYEPPTLSRVHSGDGAVLAEYARERRLFTPIDEIPPLVKQAFISAEDKNFYHHSGVDWTGVAKAVVDNVFRVASGKRLRGASTITQQVVKNFLLSGERAVDRKIKEAILALRLEEAVTKEQILELYLNEIFLGVNSYGVTAATANYFGKRLEDLEPHEAAFLAALPKAPSDIHPVRRKDRATDRRNYVLREMRENGYLTDLEYEEAVAKPLETLLSQPLAQRRAESLPWDYFVEEIRRQLIERFGRGEDGQVSAEAGEKKVYGGGLSIRATVDPDLQDLARRTLQRRLTEYATGEGFDGWDGQGYDGPIAKIEDLNAEDEAVWREQLAKTDVPRDVAPWKPAVVLSVGRNTAVVGVEGVESEEPITIALSDVKDWARKTTGKDSSGVLRLGPKPDSALEVWVEGDVIYVEPLKTEAGDLDRWVMRHIPEVNGALVAMDPHTGRVLAMQGGFSFQSSVFNRATQAERQPGSSFKPFVYAAALENGYKPNTIVLDAPVVLEQVQGDDWKPKNYSGKFYGPSPLRYGIEYSQNLMTVRVAMDVGLEAVAGYAETFGVYDDMPPLLSYALGAGETTLMRLVASYAMFVNGGKRIDPTLIDRIQDRHGETIFRHDDRVCLECQAPDWSGQGEPYVPDEGEQVMDPVTAYQVVSMLEGVTRRGTASKIGRALDFPVAGKTGTTNDARDAWFIGFGPDLVVGCFVGYDTPRSLGPRMAGGRLCAPVFERFMAEAMKDRPKHDFRIPVGVALQKINRSSGACVSEFVEGEGAIWEVFRDADDPCAQGSVVGGFAGGGFGAGGPGSLDAGSADGAADGGGVPGVPRPPEPTVGLGTGGLY
ncbi:MAG: penicillin-binding protein 1A [Pseudomonadota bacterium]